VDRGYNDLVSLQQSSILNRKKLWMYSNNGQGTAVGDPTELRVACPVRDPAIGCGNGKTDTWSGDDHWHNADQIIAPGKLNNDDLPDLLVKQGKQLWAYYVSPTAELSTPVLVGGSDWDQFTVIAPGDVNHDGAPDLWLRENATGDIFQSYGSPSREEGVTVDFTTWGAPGGRLKIATGMPRAAYPALGSVGNVTGDPLPDLWAVNATGQLATFTGTGVERNVTAIDPRPVFLANLTAATAHWKLTGQNGTTTPSTVGNFPATATGITWPTATIGGHNTTYAAFNGPQSVITANTWVVDARKSFTFSTWVKPGPSGTVISQDNNRNSAFALFADPDSKMWRFAISKADTDGSNYDWAGTTENDHNRYTPDSWQQLTAVYNADTSLMSLYVNGVLASTGHHLASTSAPPVGPLVFGRYKQNGNPEFYHEGLRGR
jgi:hypothetical protein